MNMRAFFLVSLLVSLVVSADIARALEGWSQIGTRTVAFGQHDETISIGQRAGMFRSIMFEVVGGSLEMNNVNVAFGNGQAFSPPTRLIFNEGSRSRVIDLPGGPRGRFIESITFTTGSIRPNQGRATVIVYGR
jgi:hypothetical protein